MQQNQKASPEAICAYVWSEALHKKWVISDAYPAAVSALRNADDANLRKGFCQLKHKNLNMEHIYDDMWREEERTGTMIIALVAVVRTKPKFSSMPVGKEFFYEATKCVGGCYPAIREDIQKTRKELTKLKRDAERFQKTGIDPVLNKKIDEFLQLRAMERAIAHKEMQAIQEKIKALENQIEGIEKQWKVRLDCYNQLVGKLEISQTLEAAWIDELACMDEAKLQRYGYDSERYIEEKKKEHRLTARKQIVMMPNFEQELDLKLAQISEAMLKEKKELLEKWLEDKDPRSFREYCEAAGVTPFAKGVMHIDESTSGANTPRTRGPARMLLHPKRRGGESERVAMIRKIINYIDTLPPIPSPDALEPGAMWCSEGGEMNAAQKNRASITSNPDFREAMRLVGGGLGSRQGSRTVLSCTWRLRQYPQIFACLRYKNRNRLN